MVDVLSAIEEWYWSNCDGDWEHSWGVSIETLDNPGWLVDISLAETGLEGKMFDQIQVDRDDNDWIFCCVKEKTFRGRGGPKNLAEILAIFLEWQKKLQTNH